MRFASFDRHLRYRIHCNQQKRKDGGFSKWIKAHCSRSAIFQKFFISAQAVCVTMKLSEYMNDKCLKIAGSSREITMIDYGLTNDTEKFVTEITIPVKK